MATLISIATGSFTAAGTWGVCDTTALLDSEAGSTASTTSYVYSSTFTPGVITTDGIAVKIASRTSGATGTMSVELFNNTGSLSVATVTINATDLDNLQSSAGWVFFKFSSSQLLLAATAYKIGFKTSVSATVSLFRDSTAGNWARQLRTTTTAAPAASDTILTLGELTGAGTGNDITVTMDNTATTSFGSITPVTALCVGKRATMTFGTTASTNYYLKYKGLFAVYSSGTLNIGTSGTRMPSTSTAVLEMDSATNVDTGLNIFPGGIFNAYGATMSFVSALLTADAAAAATSLTTSVSTGWKNGDVVALAATTRTSTQTESKALGADASGTSIGTIAALTNAHSGTSPTQCEIVNLNRNVKIRGISTSLQGYCVFQTTSAVNCSYVEFYQLGSATASKRGIDCTTTTGSCSITFCSLHDFTVASSISFNASGASGNGFTFSNNVTYSNANIHFSIAATTNTTWTADTNVFLKTTDVGANVVVLADIGGVFTNNIMVGSNSGAGLVLNEASSAIGTISGNTIHSNGGVGISLSQSNTVGTISTSTIWRNNSAGISCVATQSGITISTATLFGNLTQSILPIGIINLINVTSNGDTTFSTASGIGGVVSMFAQMINCDFSSTSGIKTAHTQDFNSGGNVITQVKTNNCKFGAATTWTGQSTSAAESFITFQKFNQTAGSHKTFKAYGTLSIDTTIYDTTPSLRLTPNTAATKLQSGLTPYLGTIQIPVASGSTLTPAVKVRESVVGDGTAYNGARARLIVLRNDAAGITANTVLATATAASNGAFESISGTTAAVTDDAVLSFIVDCDGTTGWVNVDTWSVT